MAFPTPDDFEQTDAQLRMQFAQAAVEFLNGAAGFGADDAPWPFLDPEILPRMQAAAEEIQPLFTSFLIEVERLRDDEVIQSHGLHGAQLRFKLAVISRREQRLTEWGGPWRFRWLIDSFQPLLNSLLAATGAGSAISEFKDGIRDSAGLDE